MRRPDIDIRRDVEAELQWDPRIDDRKISVSATDGIVTLTGETAHFAGRHVAEEIAKRVNGVRAIANDIQVKIPLSGVRSDTEIAAAAAKALRWNVATANSSITPIVKEGRVTLSGRVMWGFQKDAAERCVRTLSGVRDVSNDIMVASSVVLSEVKHRIQEALEVRS